MEPGETPAGSWQVPWDIPCKVRGCSPMVPLHPWSLLPSTQGLSSVGSSAPSTHRHRSAAVWEALRLYSLACSWLWRLPSSLTAESQFGVTDPFIVLDEVGQCGKHLINIHGWPQHHLRMVISLPPLFGEVNRHGVEATCWGSQGQ